MLKTKPETVVAFLLGKTFKKAMAMDLEEWSHDKKNLASSRDRPCHKI